MILSVIDIGTNTILMVTAAFDERGAITILGDEHEIARLGKGVDASRTILPETFVRVEHFLLRYRELAQSYGAMRIVAFGTSALRDASNRQAFVDAMLERTGIEIELLSGKEEAASTFRGAFFGIDDNASTRAVLDIGGGSTEIAFGDAVALRYGVSVDVGAVRITERFFQSLPPSPESLEEARQYIRGAFSTVFELPSGTSVMGVAGTVTTLGAIDAGLTQFNAAALDGRKLEATTISRMVDLFRQKTQHDTEAIPQVSSGRADIILGGTIILDEFMQRNRLDTIRVSTRGLRYGVLMREIERSIGDM